MSGVEVVGVVLGSLPLLISALEHYSHGISTVRKYRQFEKVFSSLLLDLRSESCIFTNSCELLLRGIVSFDEHAGQLAKDLGSARWRDPEVDTELRRRLDDSYEVYIDNVRRMREAMDEFKDELKLDSNGQVQFRDKSFKSFYKRVRISLKHDSYEALIRKIKDYNATLNQLSAQASDFKRVPLQKSSAPNFGLIQSLTRSLYTIFNSNLQCQCRHSVNLRLESRLVEKNKSVYKSGTVQGLKFRVGFASGRQEMVSGAWIEADATVFEGQTAKSGTAFSTKPSQRLIVTEGSNSQDSKPLRKGVRFIEATQETPKSLSDSDLESIGPILNLCKALTLLHYQPPSACIGYLSAQRSKHRLTLLSPNETAAVGLDPLISLHDILKEKSTVSESFTRGVRLSIGPILASSILQLHGTDWMNNIWTDQDIYFIKTLRGVDFSHPFVTAVRTLPRTPAKSMPSYILSENLFSLGVVLIELWFGKTLQSFYNPEDLSDNGSPHTNADFECANRLVKQLYEDAGANYASVVGRCIRCNFDRPTFDLSDENFQTEIHNQVVELLQECYRYFKGINL